ALVGVQRVARVPRPAATRELGRGHCGSQEARELGPKQRPPKPPRRTTLPPRPQTAHNLQKPPVNLPGLPMGQARSQAPEKPRPASHSSPPCPRRRRGEGVAPRAPRTDQGPS